MGSVNTWTPSVSSGACFPPEMCLKWVRKQTWWKKNGASFASHLQHLTPVFPLRLRHVWRSQVHLGHVAGVFRGAADHRGDARSRSCAPEGILISTSHADDLYSGSCVVLQNTSSL